MRLRVFLFFLVLALGSVAVVAFALYTAIARGDLSLAGASGPLIIASFLLLGLVMGVWFAFDRYLALPIERLAAEMRVRAHCGSVQKLDLSETGYLGDLAAAADAVTQRLGEAAYSTAEVVSRETARLETERRKLTALLSEIPVATLIVSAADTIVLYDGQAAEILAQVAPPRLNAPLSDYFDPAAIAKARDGVAASGQDERFELWDAKRAIRYATVMKRFSDGGYMLIVDDARVRLTPEAPRPLVYDFALLDEAPFRDRLDCPLRKLVFCVFDTETTGLIPHRDAIVQIGAVRLVGGRIVAGESLDILVDPGRPIPPSATKIHGIDDARVAGAPRIAEAGRRFFDYARDAVLVAHNAPFDIGFLRRQEAEMGVRFDHPILDTVLVSAVVFGTTESHMLDALCERLGVTIPEDRRHTALGDAIATAEALQKMLPLLEARGLDTLGRLLAETRRHGRLVADLN